VSFSLSRNLFLLEDTFFLLLNAAERREKRASALGEEITNLSRVEREKLLNVAKRTTASDWRQFSIVSFTPQTASRRRSLVLSLSHSDLRL